MDIPPIHSSALSSDKTNNQVDYETFYEGKFVVTKDFRFRGDGIIGKIYRSIAMDYPMRRATFLQKHLTGNNNVILDLGCGGGTILFTEYGKVIGVDLSVRSLLEAGAVYDYVTKTDIGRLPFRDNFFDYVVSIDVLGHIPIDQKNQVLREIKRVLKPGGKSVYSAIETDGLDIVSWLAHREPSLYEEVFIWKYGHFGYEYPSQVIKRFQRNGYIVLDQVKILGGLFVDPWFYIEWFSQSEYRRRSVLLYCISFCCRALYGIDRHLFGRKEILVSLAKFTLGALSCVPDNYILPFDYSRAIAVCASKRTE